MKRLNGIAVNAVITVILTLTLNTANAMETAVLKGQVTDVEGKAVTGAEIFIYSSPDTRRPADFISARTATGGRFSVTMPAGKWWAVARLRKGEKYGPLTIGDKHSGGPVEVELEAGEEYETGFKIFDIREAARLVKKTREDFFKLTGRTMDKNGVPVKNIYVMAVKGKDVPEIPAYVSAWTYEEGEYTLYIPPGKYSVGYAAEFPPESNYRITGEINIEGEVKNYDITVETKE